MIRKTRFNYALWYNHARDQFWYTPNLQPALIKFSFSYIHGLKPGE